MFAYFLLMVNVLVATLGIYYFDFKPDQQINDPMIIVLSLLTGIFVMALIFIMYIEILYLLVGKNKTTTSKTKHFLAKLIMSVPIVFMNLKVKVKGYENLPNTDGFSIYSNHTSMMDIPILMYYLKNYPVAFLAKKEVENMVMIGKWVQALGGVMIDRSNAKKGGQSILNVINNVKNGSSMVIFPEGTREKKLNHLLEFKPGAFKVALKSEKPLLPVSIIKKNRKFWPLPFKITLMIHEPLEYNDIKGMTSKELSEKVKEIIHKPIRASLS